MAEKPRITRAYEILKQRNELFQIYEEIVSSIENFNLSFGVKQFKMPDIFRFIDKTKYSFQSNDPKNSTNKEFVRIPEGVNILLSQPLPHEYRMSNVEITNIKGFLGGESEIFLIFHELFHSAVKENFFWVYKASFEKVNHQIDEKDLSKIKSAYLEFWDEGITDFLAKTAYLYYCRSRPQILPFEYSCYPFHLDFIGSYVAGYAHSLRDMNDYHNPSRINTNDKEIYYEAFKTFY